MKIAAYKRVFFQTSIYSGNVSTEITKIHENIYHTETSITTYT